MPVLTKEKIKELFKKEGFSLVGFLNRKDCEWEDWISPWLQKNYHADMTWMEKYLKIRSNPCDIEDYAKSIISAAFYYKSEPPAGWETRNPISNYAWGDDYHLVLRKKLTKILLQIESIIPDFRGRACIDTAPLPEKIIAQQSGLGWIGKNSILINRRLGSYLFLVELVSNIEFSTDEPTKNYCGKCRKCIDACPTQAIVADGVIDSRRCVSYLTIEKRGDFSPIEKGFIDYQLFGCDICQQVCPWNKKSPYSDFSSFCCDDKWLKSDLKNPEAMTLERFDQIKIKSPVKRSKFTGFIRNMLTVAKKNLTP